MQTNLSFGLMFLTLVPTPFMPLVLIAMFGAIAV